LRIRITDLCFQYRKSLPLFDHLTFEIPLDSVVAITGDSGAGKTTLLKLIAGILQPAKGQIDIIIPGEAGNDLHFGYLFQNPDDQIVHFNVERELAFNLENRNTSPDQMKVKVEKALREYHLTDRRDASPNDLSGGEKQRLALAGMMISNPGILLLDEPCSFLDVFSQIHLYRKIIELRRKGISIIWITQELHEIQMADYVIALKHGRVVWNGQSSRYPKGKEFVRAE